MNFPKINKHVLAAFLIAAASSSIASAQRAGTFVDIFRGGAGAGASADGMIKHAQTRTSNRNGVQFGHGLAVGAGPNGLAISNSIGAGTGPLGVAHNFNVHVGRNGTHLSHGGVVSQGGNRRVVSGGQAGSSGGQVFGGSQSTGFGRRNHAWSNSHTNQWRNPVGNYQAVMPSQAIRFRSR